MIPDVLQSFLHRISHDEVSMLLPDDVEALRKNAVRWVEESSLRELSAALGCYPTREAAIAAILQIADQLESQIDSCL